MRAAGQRDERRPQGVGQPGRRKMSQSTRLQVDGDPVDQGAVTRNPGLAASEVTDSVDRASDRSATRTQVVRAAVLGAGFLALYASWQLAGWGGASHKTLIGDLFFIPINVGAVVAALLAGRRCQAVPRMRRSWQLFALALAFYLLGDAVQTYYEVVARAKPYPSLGDLGYLAFYPLALAALLLLPVTRRNRRERLTLGLDCALVALSGAVPIWYVSLGPTLAAGGQGAVAMTVSLAYPLGDMVLLVGLATLIFRGAPAGMRDALTLVGLGLVGFVVTDLVYGWINLHGSYAGGDLVDAGWMVALTFFFLAATSQPVPETAGPPTRVAASRRRASWLPYVGLAVNLAIIVHAQRHVDTTMLVVYAAVAVLVALVSVRQLVVQSELLVAQGALREAQADRSMLLDRTISRGEEERVRIAAELHDGPVQRLAALGYLLERSARLTRRGDSGGLALVDEALTELSDEVNGLRRLMADLRPPVLDESGLENALRDHLTTVFRQTDVTAELVGRLGAHRLPPDTETVLYRVAQEALLNVAQHASAATVCVRLERMGSSVVLSIDDDGVGFTQEQARARLRDGHFGLVGMRERIELGGGHWQLDSSPGQGTRISATLPDDSAVPAPPTPGSDLELAVRA
jgi:signal transduction histidine kinase